MLPKENRLKKKKDFENVFKKGKGFKEKFLFLKIRKNELNVNRFGFAVSLKVSKKAVVRNKLKRQLREIVKAKLPQVKPGIDGIIVVLPGLEDKNFQQIEEIANKLFKKAKIINNTT